jgi:tRNA G37 N-methylase Trm5
MFLSSHQKLEMTEPWLHQQQQPHRQSILQHNFQHAKMQCLGKRDKSSAGRWDAGVIEICALLNDERLPYYTTSSCAGRCFLYTGDGIKATDSFLRCRISHQRIQDPLRYFNLNTLSTDVTGGGDPLKLFDGGRRQRKYQNQSLHQGEERDYEEEALEEGEENDENEDGGEIEKDLLHEAIATCSICEETSTNHVWWMRYEPFILHVACRSLPAASRLMSVVRPIFKNVGLTSWTPDDIDDPDPTSNRKPQLRRSSKYVVAIWGDEGLDMPLTTETGHSLISTIPTDDGTKGFSPTWLASLVNARHDRNAAKIARLVDAVRDNLTTLLRNDDSSTEDGCLDGFAENDVPSEATPRTIPKSYDVIGDVALIHSLPETANTESVGELGEAILQRNKAIKVVAFRSSNLDGTERAPGEAGLRIIAGPTERSQRIPLITTHREYGISCVVDLHHTFFSPRMGQERIRLCQQVARGEHVLVLFSGVGMDAFQVAARTEATSVTAVEYNEYAMSCALKGHQLLERNQQGVQCPGAAERLQLIHGDCLDVLPTLPRNHYHRVLAPRPKEGNVDGDQPPGRGLCGNGGRSFLDALLPVLRAEGGECHWYDFCADHEYPTCIRTRTFLSEVCNSHGLGIEVIHIAHVGSVAKRQVSSDVNVLFFVKCITFHSRSSAISYAFALIFESCPKRHRP